MVLQNMVYSIKSVKLYLFGFTDSDHVGDLDDRSTFRYVFMMGSATGYVINH